MMTTLPFARTAEYGVTAKPCDTVIELAIPSEARYIKCARNAVSDVVNRHVADPLFHADMLLAFGEACANAVLYGSESAFSEVKVTCRVVRDRMFKPRSLQVEVRNAGSAPFGAYGEAKYAMPDPDDLGGHGRGLPLMRQLTDRVDIYTENCQTVVRLTKHFP